MIYLNDTALAIVKRLVEKHSEGRLFRNTDGIPWTPDAANCRFQTLSKKIGRKVCLTDFRHTWMNRLLLTGVDGITVAVLAGHSEVSTLSRTYQHLSMNSDYSREQLQRAPGYDDSNPQMLELGQTSRPTLGGRLDTAGVEICLKIVGVNTNAAGMGAMRRPLIFPAARSANSIFIFRVICQDRAIATQETSDGQQRTETRAARGSGGGNLAKHKNSRLNIRDFCRQEKLHESAFYFWRHTIQQRGPTQLHRPQTARLPSRLVSQSTSARQRHHARTSRRKSTTIEHIVSRRSARRPGTGPGGEGGPVVIGATRGMRGGQVWIATAPVDMRKSFDGLAEVVRAFLGTIRWAATSSSFATAPASE